MLVRPRTIHFPHRKDVFMRRSSLLVQCPFAPQRPPAAISRCGFTLIEMMVAVALSLLIMLAVVTVFGDLSAGVREARARAELPTGCEWPRTN